MVTYGSTPHSRRAHVGTPLVGARTYGFQPDGLRRRAGLGQPLRGSAVLRRRPGQQRTDRLDDLGVRRAGVAQRQPEQLDAGPVLLEQGKPVGHVAGRGVLQYDRQVVGQLARRQFQPAAAGSASLSMASDWPRRRVSPSVHQVR